MPCLIMRCRLFVSLLLLLGSGFFPLRGAAAGFESDTFEPFYFIHTTDPHLTDAHALKMFRALGQTANKNQVPFVLVGGDMGSSSMPGDWSGWDSCLGSFPMPLRPIPGNHDVFSTATLQAYRNHFGDDYYAFTYNNSTFICLDSITLRDRKTYPAAYQAQWIWLEQTLAAAWAAHRTRLFILIHHPPYSSYDSENDSYYNLPKAERNHLLTLARTYSVKGILAGHLHYTFAFPTDKPPLYVMAGSAYDFDGKGLGFRLFKVGRRRVGQFAVRLDQTDWVAPAAPQKFWVTNRSAAALTLEWSPASDNVGVLRYAVWRDGVLLGYTLEELFHVTGLTAGQSHRYTVTAIDMAGNISPVSHEFQAASGSPPGAREVVLPGAGWRHLANGAPAPSDWMQSGFYDQDWLLGLGQLGFGDGDEVTTLTFGSNPKAKQITRYFRCAFDVANPATLGAPTLKLLCDDGAVVYLNGQEIGRWNMPSGAINSATLAVREIEGKAESAWNETPLNRSLLVAGVNCLAVEVHLASPASPDLSFDLQLAASTAAATTTLTRGPWLQDATTTAVTVRWRTATPAISRLAWAAQPGGQTCQSTDMTTKTEHEMRITGLKPGTRHTYRVEAGVQVLAGGDGSCTFATPPSTGLSTPTRLWVLGDSGTGNEAARQVRDAYQGYTGARPTDLWLMVGDNAYPSGTDADHQVGLFDMFPATLRSVALWPAIGNHETYSNDPAGGAHPYYNIFTLPTRGEAGGVASGTEAYYSLNYGDIHLICLDSCESDRSAAGPMLNWLKADLAATRARWLIAWFHHPPYSKGAHDSDNPVNEGDKQIAMRQNVLPLLEAAGADLVLTGHSHSYERSYLINGHYGFSETLTPAMILNHGDGRTTGNGPYIKPAVRAPREGTVYVVVGSSGLVTPGGTLNHPAMAKAMLTLGSLAIDIDGRRLDARFIDNTGAIRDEFTIWKGPPGPAAVRNWRGYR